MKFLVTWVLAAALSLSAVGCGGVQRIFRPRVYHERNLNFLPIDSNVQQFLARFDGNCAASESDNVTCRTPVMRAARRQANGTLVQVLTLDLLTQPGRDIISYWFVFRDSRLVQWGRPNEWRAVSARYGIDFDPEPAVRGP